ncbi:NADPH-dependent FMN reductase [Rhizobium tubonense]|uniref:FMN reductase n=1 Tax=Rhizobium tubonense TaxID=484088 RepID=A0A2W4EA38_9HYPH|nr:NADPH-dependent FMN reductase [Rhizobium tubonense]PZM08490.1 FMN reductase [Rhizobium tubonense]
MIEKQSRFYALCGSQRRASTNRALLEALSAAAPDYIAIEICELIGDLPIFNPDREGEFTPEIVEAFAAKIRAADGLIVACPEYAHGIPGGLKNALDWLVSRDEVPFKPVMIAHSSHRGQLVLSQLRDILTTMSLLIVEDAFLQLALVGKSQEAQRALLAEAKSEGLLDASLREFVEFIARL